MNELTGIQSGTFDQERRDLLKKLAVAGFAAGVGQLALPLSAMTAPTATPMLAEAYGPDPARLARETVTRLGGMAMFVKPGQTVVVKPNIGWDRRPEEAANTNPEVVREIVLMCLEAGAAKVKVFDRTCNDDRRCYKRSGIADAVESISGGRVEVSFVDELRYEVVEIKGASVMKKWPLYRPAIEADALINVPVLKHHGLSGITVAMKNLMGIMGSNRGNVHREIGDSLVDLNMAVKSTLTVVDATRVLKANGPQGGGTAHVKAEMRLAASTDVVAADLWGAKVFGVDPMSIPFLKKAGERGFGPSDLSRVVMR